MKVLECYEQFYDVLEDVLLGSVQPRMALCLSGGWDTRVMAGILAKHNVMLPAVTWGSKLECVIASKVAHALGFELYKYDPMNDVGKYGFTHILSTGFFDEINASGSGFWVETHEDFLKAQEGGFRGRLAYLQEFYECQTYPKRVFPILNLKVVGCLNKIPWRYRVNKQIQRWILINKFPKLWAIPYYNSLLPSSLPFEAHYLANNIKKLKIPYVIKILRRSLASNRLGERKLHV